MVMDVKAAWRDNSVGVPMVSCGAKVPSFGVLVIGDSVLVVGDGTGISCDSN